MKNKQIQSSRNRLLPDGWIKTKINVVTDNVEKINPKKYPDTLYHYCDINSIDNSKLQITNSKQFLGRDAPSRARQLIKTNDILFATVRTYLKNIAIVSNELNAQLASTGFCVIRTKINYKFVFYYVQTKRFLNRLNKIQRGTNYPAVKNSDVMNSIILVPPPNEQKRIVSKIESIFTQIDTLEESLKSIKARMKRYTQVVLKLAFEGRLVSQDPNDEPAEVLLKRPRPDVEMKMGAMRYKLPKGWIKTTLEKVVDILDSKRIPVNSIERSKRQGDVPYYGATGQVGYIDDYIFNEELVLLGEDGVPFLELLKRKAYLINGKSWVNNHAHVLRGVKVSNHFLCFFLNQVDYTSFVSGTTRLKLNQSAMKAIPIMFPDMIEQNRIVSKIESVFAHVDVVDARVSRLLKTLATLRQSVLKYAFEGKLVPQDPHDEPASILLGKIRGANDG